MRLFEIKYDYWIVGEDGVGTFIWIIWILGTPHFRRWNHRRVIGKTNAEF